MKIKAKNYLGKILDFGKTNDYIITSVDGLTPANGNINTTKVATSDGSFYNSGKVNERNIVITVIPENNIENSRLYLYEFFKPSKKVTLYFETGKRSVFIDGYVESFEGQLYSIRQCFQISIICPQPYFSDENISVFSQRTCQNLFTFPFFIPQEGVVFSELDGIKDCNILNVGAASGLIVELLATNTVRNPVIYNRTTHEKFELHSIMKSGDMILIDSRRGKKSITLIENGIRKNILSSIKKGSNWLTIESGENLFTYSCSYGKDNLQVTYKFYTLYEGV